jgi:hypothetical protein
MAGAARTQLVQRRVFLNVPYDAAYESNFLALIAALISIGRIPRCAAEEPVLGRNRMERIFKLIRGCKVSIHDLCRVTSPPRFNIPFELGITFTLSQLSGHRFIVLESQRYRMDINLSDLKGVDPLIHANSPRKVVSSVLSELGSTSGAPDIERVMEVFDHLRRVTPKLMRSHKGSKVFYRPIFNALVTAATQKAVGKGLIHR